MMPFYDPEIDEQANLPSVEGGKFPLNEPRWRTRAVPSDGFIDTECLIPVRHLGGEVYACSHSCYKWDDVHLLKQTGEELDAFGITSRKELEIMEHDLHEKLWR